MPNLSIVVPSDSIIWEKFEIESTKAYSAFCIYMKLPPDNRSLQKAVKEKLGYVKSTTVRVWQRWCSQYSWVARASAWDEEVERNKRLNQLTAIKEMNDRTVRIGQAIQQKAIERLKVLDITELSPDHLLRFMQIGTAMERLALGQPTEISQSLNISQNLNIDFTELTDDELRAVLSRRL